MTLYIIGAAILLAFVFFGFWARRQEKKRLQQAEEFYELPQIKALLDSGFIKGDDEISGEINDYPAGLYCWFEVTGTRYFTYIRCKMPAGVSYIFQFGNRYEQEQVRITNLNMIRQELKQIDGATLAKSFARLQEIAALEKLERVKL